MPHLWEEPRLCDCGEPFGMIFIRSKGHHISTFHCADCGIHKQMEPDIIANFGTFKRLQRGARGEAQEARLKRENALEAVEERAHRENGFFDLHKRVGIVKGRERKGERDAYIRLRAEENANRRAKEGKSPL